MINEFPTKNPDSVKAGMLVSEELSKLSESRLAGWQNGSGDHFGDKAGDRYYRWIDSVIAKFPILHFMDDPFMDVKVWSKIRYL